MTTTSSASVRRVIWASTVTRLSATLSASMGDPAPPLADAPVPQGSRDAIVKEASVRISARTAASVCRRTGASVAAATSETGANTASASWHASTGASAGASISADVPRGSLGTTARWFFPMERLNCRPQSAAAAAVAMGSVKALNVTVTLAIQDDGAADVLDEAVEEDVCG